MKTQFLSLGALLLCAVATVAQPNCSAPPTGLIPINDLGTGTFNGMTGGLYPNGSNNLPEAHRKAAIDIARTQIVPRDISGKPDEQNGKIVWLSIGMSNTRMETQQFLPLANAYENKNPKLILVDGAQGSMASNRVSNPGNPNYEKFWNTISINLAAAGVTENQVQVIWFKQTNPAGRKPTVQAFYDTLVVQFKRTMNDIKRRFPNAKLCYMSSRISARYASSVLNPEPYAYWTGWAMKKVIEDQINGDKQLQYGGPAANSPLLVWGIYPWSDGITPQKSNPNVFWDCAADFNKDGTHPSPVGAAKVGQWLLSFYQNDPLSCPWFFNKPPRWCSNVLSE